MVPLIEAAAEGDLARVDALLAEGNHIDDRDAEGDTALTVASAKGHFEVVRLLLTKGADIAARCNAGNSAVCAAAGTGNSDILRLLLAKGADPNVCNNRGYSPLLLAAFGSFDEAVLALLEFGGDPNVVNNEGLTPLMAAAYQDAIGAVAALLAAGSDPTIANKAGQTPLMAAANRGALRSASALLATAGAKVGESGALLLALALSAPKDSDAIAVMIIEAEGVPSGLHEGLSAMAMAVSNRRPVVLEALLDAGADPNQSSVMGGYTVTPLMTAVSVGDAECAKILLRHGADPNLRLGNMTALGNARVEGYDNIVRLLIDHGATAGAAVILHKLEGDGDSGFNIRTPLAVDLAEAWRICVLDRTGEGIAAWTRMLSESPQIRERMAYLRTYVRGLDFSIGSQQKASDLVTNYPLWLITRCSLAMQFIAVKENEAVRVVTANHVGVRKRRDDEERARTRCIEELAAIVARWAATSEPSYEIYEDSDDALTVAEFILSRLPYRQLAEAVRSPVAKPEPRGNGLEYEDRCRLELEGNNYLVRKTPATGDQGADLLASKAGVTYAIQCKNYAGSVGNAAVQEAIAAKAYYGTDYAIVVSDGKFTTSARELSARTRVILCKREGVAHVDVICAALG